MSSSEWQRCKWGDIITLEYGKSLKDYQDSDGAFPVYGTNGKIGYTDKPLCSFPSVIVGRKGAYRGIHYSKHPFFVIDTAFYLNPKGRNLDLKFAYYQLLTQNINEMDSGSAIPSTSREDFYNLEVNLPPLNIQNRISYILSSLDDKIELNLQTNNTLETVIQTLFKEWFINFNFPDANGNMKETVLGSIPENWEIGTIGELFDFVIGGDWGKDYLDEEFANECAVIRGTDLSDIVNSKIEKIPIRHIKTASLKKRELKEGDIVFEISGGSKDQPTGRSLIITNEILNLFGKKIIPASFCRLIRAKDLNISYFLASYLKRLYDNGGTWDYQLQSTGISNFQFQYFMEKEILAIPESSVLYKFRNFIEPINKLIGENILQAQTLLTLRNFLLPKLVKGEIDIMS